MQAKRGALRRSLLCLALAAPLAAGSAAKAVAGPVDLTVVDRDTGQDLPVWRRHGRRFVAGDVGARYGLRVTNHTDGRILVVLSVDGVNILTGETAAYGQRGYVFEPHQSYEVNGWRKSDTETAAFTFASLSNAYAVRTGRPDEVGVIGLAAFTEARPVALQVEPPTAPRERLTEDFGARAQAPSARAAAGATAEPPLRDRSTGAREEALADGRLGTGHGPREWSPVRTVGFVRQTTAPQYVARIDYDSYARLVSRGVIPPRPPWEAGERPPRPFPASPGADLYVPDPPR